MSLLSSQINSVYIGPMQNRCNFKVLSARLQDERLIATRLPSLKGFRSQSPNHKVFRRHSPIHRVFRCQPNCHRFFRHWLPHLKLLPCQSSRDKVLLRSQSLHYQTPLTWPLHNQTPLCQYPSPRYRCALPSSALLSSTSSEYAPPASTSQKRGSGFFDTSFSDAGLFITIASTPVSLTPHPSLLVP